LQGTGVDRKQLRIQIIAQVPDLSEEERPLFTTWDEISPEDSSFWIQASDNEEK
jgi:hypothetical protein